MQVRSISVRLEKLEARQRHGDQMLLIWRKPGEDIADVVNANGGLFGSGDKVLCAEWMGDGEPPEPAWQSNFPRGLSQEELGYCHAYAEQLATGKVKRSGLMPHVSTKRASEMRDDELWYAMLGVST